MPEACGGTYRNAAGGVMTAYYHRRKLADGVAAGRLKQLIMWRNYQNDMYMCIIQANS